MCRETHHGSIGKDPGDVFLGYITREPDIGQVRIPFAYTLQIAFGIGAIGAGNDDLEVCLALRFQQLERIQQRLHGLVGAKFTKCHDLAGSWRQRKGGHGRRFFKTSMRRQQHVVRMIFLAQDLHVLRNRDRHPIHAQHHARDDIANIADKRLHQRLAGVARLLEVDRFHDVVQQYDGWIAGHTDELWRREPYACGDFAAAKGGKLQVE